MPDSFALTPTGLLLVANGWDPMLRWDSLLSQAEPAGVLPPTTACTVQTPQVTGVTDPSGPYFALVRFVDQYGNVSNPSPLSPMSTQLPSTGGGKKRYTWGHYVTQVIPIVNATPTPAMATLVSPGHGLSTGDVIFLKVVTYFPITPFASPDSLYTIKVLSPGSFLLTGAVTAIAGQTDAATLEPIIEGIPGAFLGVTFNSLLFGSVSSTPTIQGPWGVWLKVSAGTANAAPQPVVLYSDVPTPREPKVVRRQILRNTAGQATVFFVDIDTTDLTSSSFTSFLDDESVSAQPSFALFDADNNFQGDLFHVPPNHKSVLAYFLGRMYAAVDIDYQQGSCAVTQGSSTVQGAGTEWANWTPNDQVVNRFLYVPGGASSPLQINSVDPVKQTLTLSAPYPGASDSFAGYTIRPAPGEKKLVYYSEAGLPEAWPAANAFEIPQDGDAITGLMPMGTFLYILENKQIYRLTVQTSPAVDGFVFRAAQRGCVNNRCWVLVDDVAYLLDQQGVYSFTGGSAEPLSEAIGDLFDPYPQPDDSYRVNWSASANFHCVHYPAEACVRWFISLAGDRIPRHALVYAYRTKAWWLEEYPWGVGASALGYLGQSPQVFLAGPANKVLAFGAGTLDGPDPGLGTVRGQVTASTPTSFSDSRASFASSKVVHYPVQITAGRGKGQERLVVSVSGQRINVDSPWDVQPDVSSTYQLGGIPWQFRSGWFRWLEQEDENPRRLEIVFEPCLQACTLEARLYLDRASIPVVWDVTYASVDANQFASTHGSADLVADLTKPSGFVQKRLDGWREYYIDGMRFFQLELAGVTNQDPVLVYQVTVDGAH